MAHKSQLGVIVIDCKADNLEQASKFWSEALGYEAKVDSDFPDYVELATPKGHIKMLLQAVTHDSRIHMDVETDNRDAERSRLEAIGAVVVREVDEGDKHWTVMEAPTGHRFCLVKPQSAEFSNVANNWGDV